MAKVRLYQDIDGCLNAENNAHAWRKEDDTSDSGYMQGVASPVHDEDGVRHEDSGYGPKYRMEWNSRLIDALNELPVELTWATTWREDARAVGTLMGLTHGRQRVLHPVGGRTTSPSIYWKYGAIRLDQEADPSPFIWVDDEIENLPHIPQDYMTKTLGGLLISPVSNVGLTPYHIGVMKEYLADRQ